MHFFEILALSVLKSLCRLLCPAAELLQMLLVDLKRGVVERTNRLHSYSKERRQQHLLILTIRWVNGCSPRSTRFVTRKSFVIAAFFCLFVSLHV